MDFFVVVNDQTCWLLLYIAFHECKSSCFVSSLHLVKLDLVVKIAPSHFNIGESIPFCHNFGKPEISWKQTLYSRGKVAFCILSALPCVEVYGLWFLYLSHIPLRCDHTGLLLLSMTMLLAF